MAENNQETKRETLHATFFPFRLNEATLANYYVNLNLTKRFEIIRNLINTAKEEDLDYIKVLYGKIEGKSAGVRKLETLKSEMVESLESQSVAPNVLNEIASTEPNLLGAMIQARPGVYAMFDNIPENLKNEKVGYVTYEKLEFINNGTKDTNEVIAKFLIGPQDTLTTSRKSWSKTATEFVESTTSLMEEEFNTSLSENKELTESFEKQIQHSMSLGGELTMKGIIGPIEVDNTNNLSINNAINTLKNNGSKRKKEATHNGSTRSQKEHKITVKTNTEYGSEKEIIQEWSNPSKEHPLEIKFTKAVIEWLIRHLVYDTRLCIDVMVKNPGVNLRKRNTEEFDPTTVVQNSFLIEELLDKKIPQSSIELSTTITFDDNEWHESPFSFLIPEGYEPVRLVAESNKGVVSIGNAFGHLNIKNTGEVPNNIANSVLSSYKEDVPVNSEELDGDYQQFYKGDINDYVEGNLLSGFVHNKKATKDTIKSSEVIMKAYFDIKEEYMQQWKDYEKHKVTEAAYEKWKLNQDLKYQEQSLFDDERNISPSLLLRQEERQQLMGAMVKYLQGEPVTPIDEIDSEPEGLDGRGRFISILHEMMKWDECSYFLYPYFWDTSVFEKDNILDIMRIDHKDAMRRAFLQSSWSRVILPIKKEKELEFLEFMYPGIRERIQNQNANLDDYPQKNIVLGYREMNEFRNRIEANGNLPEVVEEWSEFTPLDEPNVTMKLMKDMEIFSTNESSYFNSRKEIIESAETMIKDEVNKYRPRKIQFDDKNFNIEIEPDSEEE